ncbi:MAG: ThuA domain-containing protein [Spirochaetales bacterium]
MKITVWNEFRHEQKNEQIRAIYPRGIHGALAEHLETIDGATVRTATLDDPEQGLPESVLDDTDVLLWWGHMAHGEVSDETTERVHKAILAGMGFIALHSAHFSKPLKRVLGTSCGLSWRVDDGHERLWVTDPTHPIAAGIDRYFEVPKAEMYGEFFDVPTPDELVFVSWFPGGEVFRSGMLWKRGYGKVFYFRPGHETYPIYHQKEVLRVIENACRYCARSTDVTVTGITDIPQIKVSPEEKRRAEQQ